MYPDQAMSYINNYCQIDKTIIDNNTNKQRTFRICILIQLKYKINDVLLTVDFIFNDSVDIRAELNNTVNVYLHSVHLVNE